jgi:ribosomal protein S21
MAMLPEVMTWDINDFSANNSKKGKSAPLEMRNLRPSTGRTIEKWGTIDVARAFQVLDFACRKNNVAKDFRRQRFHERPGLKRKRLRSERWRALFKEGFRATCARVEVLRRQGW